MPVAKLPLLPSEVVGRQSQLWVLQVELELALGHCEQVRDIVVPEPRAHVKQLFDSVRHERPLQAAEHPSGH